MNSMIAHVGMCRKLSRLFKAALFVAM
jgi:hypothetical protein